MQGLVRLAVTMRFYASKMRTKGSRSFYGQSGSEIHGHVAHFFIAIHRETPIKLLSNLISFPLSFSNLFLSYGTSNQAEVTSLFE